MSDTVTQILNIAQEQIMRHGFNGFSYKDISDQLGIKTSSIHYHFGTKQDLAEALMIRYVDMFHLLTQEIEQSSTTSLDKLTKITKVFSNGVVSHSFCLCGMMLSDIAIMSENVQALLTKFTCNLEKYLELTIKNGIERGEFNASLSPADEAAHLLATLEGAMLVARSRGIDYFNSVANQALTRLLL